MKHTDKLSFEYLWANKKRLVTLKWIHPEWLRAIISLLIALPLFVGVVLGLSVFVLLVPMILLVKFIGFAWGFVVWIALLGYISFRIRRWLQYQRKHRPRRSLHRYNSTRTKA